MPVPNLRICQENTYPGRLERNPYYNKSLEADRKVEQGTETATNIGGDIQNRLG
jgi:hypothetical protein